MEIISNFSPEFQIYKCADLKHDIFNCIHFENGYAYASNARIAVRANLGTISNFDGDQLKLLEGKNINAKVFKEMLDYPEVIIEDKGFRVIDERNPMFFGFNAQLDFAFPAVENVVQQTQEKVENADAINRIGINASYLSRLSLAMHAEQVRFDFNANGACLVRPLLGADDILGIIMPIMLDD